MFRRLLLFFLLIPTLALFLSQKQAFSATSGVEFTLRGILISPTNRSALINGKIVREGERVDGIAVLAIEEDAVVVLSGTEEYAVPVGSGAWLEPSLVRPVRSAEVDGGSPSPVRRVNSGDTLSGIAEDYAGNGLSLHQVMVALFEANPQAFDGNLNRLHAGAQLHIPESLDMRRLDPETALVEVLRQTESWQAVPGRSGFSAHQPASVEAQPVSMVAAFETSEYGPVRFGETLSEIAVQVSGNDVSMHEMMAALFEANPHAFGDNIDLLHEGAVLRVPGSGEINPTPALAANNYR
ncbi:MAG: FimV/HubP family polar landmark protein [Woeseiaceae bacterium]